VRDAKPLLRSYSFTLFFLAFLVNVVAGFDVGAVVFTSLVFVHNSSFRGKGVRYSFANGNRVLEVEALLSVNHPTVTFRPSWVTGSVNVPSQPRTRSKPYCRRLLSRLDWSALSAVPKVSEMDRLIGAGVVVGGGQ